MWQLAQLVKVTEPAAEDTVWYGKCFEFEVTVFVLASPVAE